MVLRRACRDARNFSKRAILATERVRRASTPRRTQTSSCASSLSALAWVTASAVSSASLVTK